MNNVLKYFFKSIAYIFHPLLLPTYASLLLFWANPYAFAHIKGGGLGIVPLIFILTFFFPVFALFLMKKLNFVDDYYLASQKQRFMPYIAILIFYIWAYLVIRKQYLPPVMNWMMLGSCLAISFAFIVNTFLKISIHSLGAACLAAVAIAAHGFALHPFNTILIIVLLACGLVGSCRIYLKAHQTEEVYAGYMVGFVGMMVANWFV